jgi:hypothetical protein
MYDVAPMFVEASVNEGGQANSRLQVSLTTAQVDAANRLHDTLQQWKDVDAALQMLGKHVPGFQLPSVLLKVAAVNQLYSTNLYAVVRMARHVVTVMDSSDSQTDPALVEELADLPRTGETQQKRLYVSLASKFAHFFVDPDTFPIYDDFAKTIVRRHLGQKLWSGDNSHPYQAFVSDISTLLKYASLPCSVRELDRYLWIAGQYRAWSKKLKVNINTELRDTFEIPTPIVQAGLDALHVEALW